LSPPCRRPTCLAAGRRHLRHGRVGCRRVGRRRARRHRRGCIHGRGAEVAAAPFVAIKAAMSIAAIPPARQRQPCPPQRGSQRQEPPSAVNVAAAEIAVEILVIVLAAPPSTATVVAAECADTRQPQLLPLTSLAWWWPHGRPSSPPWWWNGGGHQVQGRGSRRCTNPRICDHVFFFVSSIQISVLSSFLSAEQVIRVIAAGSKIHEPLKYIKTPRDNPPIKKRPRVLKNE
jgi:hypothetical protein